MRVKDQKPFPNVFVCVRSHSFHPPNTPEIEFFAYPSGCLGEDEPDLFASEGRYTTCV